MIAAKRYSVTHRLLVASGYRAARLYVGCIYIVVIATTMPAASADSCHFKYSSVHSRQRDVC